jgi:hypothetical protein
MLLIVAGILIVSFISMAFLGILNAHVTVRRLEAALDGQSLFTSKEFEFDNTSVFGNRVDRFEEEERFTASLLSLSRAHLQSGHNSPARVHDESSSSVSVPLVQSKTPVREL